MSPILDSVSRLARGDGPPTGAAQLLGLTIVSVRPGEAVLDFVADERHTNPMGTLHGGLLSTLADSAMGLAYAATLAPNESFTTLELKVNFLKPIRSGHLRATGQVLKHGRTIGLTDCRVTDATGALVAHATSTVMTLRDAAAEGR